MRSLPRVVRRRRTYRGESLLPSHSATQASQNWLRPFQKSTLCSLRRKGPECFAMFHVYLLRSVLHPQMTYVGFTTKDVCKRMQEHNRGFTHTTRPHVPWSIEVVVTFRDRQKAEQFEKYLKNGSGYAFAKRHLWSNPGSAKLA